MNMANENEIRAVIDEMAAVAAGTDDSALPEWLSENRAQIDQWQSRLRATLVRPGETTEQVQERWERQRPMLTMMQGNSCFGNEICKHPPCACAQEFMDLIEAHKD